ncbi:MAG: hypothetical protein AAF266_02925, partial [Planctomycetota bacterium]
MQVTIPSCVNTVELCENGKKNKYVAVYVSTPYGVTNHLHVPVYPTAPAPDEPADIAAQVKAAVDERMASLNLPPREISVEPVGPTTKLVVNATSSAEKPDVIQLRTHSGDVPSISTSLADARDPRLAGKMVRFHGVVLGEDGFKGELIPLTDFIPVTTAAATTFPALGTPSKWVEDGKTVTTWLGWPALCAQIAPLATLDKLEKGNGSVTCKVVYYAEIQGSSTPLRLLKELDVEVKLRKASTVASTTLRMVVPAERSAHTLPAPAEPKPREDCGCEASHSDWSAFETTALSGVRRQRVAARFASVAASVDEPAAAGETLSLAGLSEDLVAKIDALQASLDAGQQRQELVEQRLADLDAAGSGNGSLRNPMVINVGVDSPDVTVNTQERRRSHDHPLIGQLKNRSMECWRNLRDTIPAY